MRTTNWHDLSIYVGKVVESINEIYEPHREMVKFLKELEIVCKFLHKHGKELPLDVHKQIKRAILKDIETEYWIYAGAILNRHPDREPMDFVDKNKKRSLSARKRQ